MIPNIEKYGLDTEPNTIGIVAFPGINSNRSRTQAKLDGYEKWMIALWWENIIPAQHHKFSNVSEFLSLETEYTNIKTVIHYSYNEEFQFSYFGFGSGFITPEALNHALIESTRNESVLRKFFLNNSTDETIHKQGQMPKYEKRLLYFSQSEGFKKCKEKISQNHSTKNFSHEVLCDKEVVGPWSQYCYVWRYALRFPYNNSRKGDANYFLF